MVLSGVAVSKCDSSLRLSRAALVGPPDSAALAVHDGDDVARAGDRIEVDDRVVAELQLVDVSLEEVEVILVAVIVLVTDALRAPLLVSVVVRAGVDDDDVEAHLRQGCSPWIGSWLKM